MVQKEGNGLPGKQEKTIFFFLPPFFLLSGLSRDMAEEQLQNQLRVLQQERETMIAELAALRLANPSQARPHPTARYAGGSNLFEFLNQIRMMLRRYRGTFYTDQDCIDYISMHLTD